MAGGGGGGGSGSGEGNQRVAGHCLALALTDDRLPEFRRRSREKSYWVLCNDTDKGPVGGGGKLNYWPRKFHVTLSHYVIEQPTRSYPYPPQDKMTQFSKWPL